MESITDSVAWDWIGSEKSVEIITANSSLSVDVGESVILNYDS